MIALGSRLQDFAEFLRANDMPVDAGTLLQWHTVAAMGYAQTRTQLRVSARSCTCTSEVQWRRFDALFDTFWHANGEPLSTGANDERQGANNDQSLTNAGQQKLLGMAGTSEKQRQEEEFFGAGDFKALSLADFRFVFDPRQMHVLTMLVERMARRARKQYCRRELPSTKRGHAIDLRRTLRQSLRYCGQPLDLRYNRKRQRLHRFVLLLDISQSMDVYARLFLRFTRILLTVFQRSDAFVFNTDLNELAKGYARLSEEDLERVLNAHGKGWLGGTRIAQSLETFTDKHMHRRVDNKTTVLIFSDGCDTDPPDRLAGVVANIQRRAGKLIWVNPLLGRFEPGEADPYMDPIVPFVDHYCSAHNLESLMALESILLEKS